MFQRYKQYIPHLYFALLTLIVFVNNGTVSLWDQDEAAYAGFAKEMISTGNWLIPDFMWSEIHRKPPLHFWDIAFSYKLFGINEFSVRFPSALFLLLTYILVYLAGSPLFGRKNAFAATVVLSTSLFIPSLAKVSVTDATLLFFSTACAFALLNIIQKKSVKWTCVFWISFALALLTKGPPIVLFTGVFALILFILHPNRKYLFSMHPWFFLPLACLPLFLWGYFVSKKDGGVFINWMIDWYVLKRVNSSVLGQTGPPGTHLLSIFIFFIPYFMFLPQAFWKAVSSIFKKEKSINFLLSSWFISGWFLYEWSPSKLPSYVIAAHVPLAVLIGKEILYYVEEKKLPARGLVIAHFSLMLMVFGALFAAPQLISFPSNLQVLFILVSIILIAVTIFSIYKLRSQNFINTLFGTNVLFQILIWCILLPAIDPLKNGSKRIADYVDEKAGDHSTVLIANQQGHPPSLPFYLSRNFQEIKEENNMDSLLTTFRSNTPCVMILNREQMEISQKEFPETNFKEIKSMMTDRDEKAHYYIAINKSAQKKNQIADNH
jgi:4-amino-4-deoxy-L-arabinose transferase-like glycosyltransferase